LSGKGPFFEPRNLAGHFKLPLFLLFARLPPLGSVPQTWRRYQASIDNKTGFFTCFDASNVINVSQINDGYADCDDGSDEPGTSSPSAFRFYCQNAGYIASTID
jgi:hypothetical protein